jgi:outer membrane protein
MAHAQANWSLERCIKFAVEKNLQVKQGELNTRLGALQVAQNKYSQYPNLNLDVTNGLSFGRSVDPTTNQFIRSSYFFNGLSASAGALLFGWFSKKNQIAQSELELLATQATNQQVQNDIALNIAVGYLRILMAKEQVKVNEIQLSNDLLQFNNTAKRVKAGQLPELNKAQMEAQISSDSLTLLMSEIEVSNGLLDLRALLNLDYETTFDIETPGSVMLDANALINYPQPNDIYKIAKYKQAKLGADSLKILSANKQLDIAKAAQYPTVNISGSSGTNFASTVKDITSFTYKGEEPIGNILVGDSLLPVTRPTYDFTTRTQPFFKQYDNNLRQTIALGIQIPVFNGYNAKQNIQRSKINIASAQLTLQQSELRLQQDIYKAYNDAKTSIIKYQSAIRVKEAAQLALDYATKRYNAGMLNTQEYTNQQNTLARNAIQCVQAKYESIFKLKVLDFYLGNSLKL